MIIDTCPTCHQIVDDEDFFSTHFNGFGAAHINADRHAQTCNDENCGECNPSA
jgi:hypothetical protein